MSHTVQSGAQVEREKAAAVAAEETRVKEEAAAGEAEVARDAAEAQPSTFRWHT